MPYVNLGKFFPAKKAWKKFTQKVQIKLSQLHPSKITAKKPTKTKTLAKHRPSSYRKTGKKNPSCWPAAFCVQKKIFKLKPKQKRCYYFQKTVSPVYIDQLFVEPAVSLTVRGEGRGKEKVNEDGDDVNKSADDMWEGLGSPQMNINQRAEEFINSFRAEMVLQERIARELL